MLKTLSQWVNWTDTNIEDEWNTWENWQKYQDSSHYESSDIFQYYLSQRSNFQPPINSCLNESNNKYYVYSFGDFACLLVNSSKGCNLVDYVELLLDVYDVCKGFSRRIKGDPDCITTLRNVIYKRVISPLQYYNFSQHAYPYHKIHAHTVAHYSLSTLLMRLISHYMAQTTFKDKYPEISLSTCHESYKNCIFGLPMISPTAPINIKPCKNKSEEKRPSSWPRGNYVSFRCKTCTRVTDKLWGDFESCFDCHHKRICSVCGVGAMIITKDDLPKCSMHV